MVLIAAILRNLFYLALFVIGAQGWITCGAGFAPDGTDYESDMSSYGLCGRDSSCLRQVIEIPGHVILAASDGNVSQRGDYHHFYAEVKLGPYNDTCDFNVGTVEVFTSSEDPVNFFFEFYTSPILETGITCLVENYYLYSRSTVAPLCSSNQYCRTRIDPYFREYRNFVRCDKLGEMVVTLECPPDETIPAIRITCSARSPLGISHNGSMQATRVQFSQNHGQHTIRFYLTISPKASKTDVEVHDEISFHLLSEPQKSLNITFIFTYDGIENTDVLHSPPSGINYDTWFSPPEFICCGKSKPAFLSELGESNPTLTKFNMGLLYEDSYYENKRIGRFSNGKPFCRGIFITEIDHHGILFCKADGIEYLWEYLLKIDDFTPASMSEMYVDTNLILLRNNLTTNVHNYLNVSSPVTFYEKETLSFQCVFWDTFLEGDVHWTITYADGNRSFWKGHSSYVEEERLVKSMYAPTKETVKKVVAISSTTVEGKHGMMSLTCQVAYWNDSRKFASAANNITILKSTPPTFGQHETFVNATVGSPLELHCSSDPADPSPTYTWTFPETDSFQIIDPSDENYSNLTFRDFPKRAAGHYICLARNFGGDAEKHFHVNITTAKVGVTKGSQVLEYTLGGVGVMFLVLITIVVGLLRRYYLQKGKLSELEIRYFYKGDTNALQTDGLAHENAEYMPFRAEFEVKWKDFTISMEKLGSGAFGEVYKGCLNQGENWYVAVKTVKPGIDKAMLLSLLSEIKVMVYIGKHKNIVELVGACTDFLRDGRVYMLVELCDLGCLESFLRRNASKFSSTVMPNSEYLDLAVEVTPGENYFIGTKDMINWSKQIACGMCYLMEKKVIHGDLATRNVLLVNKYHAKITDFGLSHHLINYQTYAKKSDGPLPWRWMALETLKTFAFSPKSDVWAFGVTLWEIFSLGQIPYPGIKWTADFVGFLEDDLRLSQPKRASDSIYKIMKMCWNADPEIRPNFQFLQQYLVACDDSYQTAEA